MSAPASVEMSGEVEMTGEASASHEILGQTESSEEEEEEEFFNSEMEGTASFSKSD